MVNISTREDIVKLAITLMGHHGEMGETLYKKKLLFA